MNFSDFCRPFYVIGVKDSYVLKGVKTQSKIAEFFLSTAMKHSDAPLLHYQDDTFRKFFKGEREVPSDIWKTIEETFDATDFEEDLTAILNENYLLKIAKDLEISLEKGKVLEKDILVNTIAMQLLEIAKNRGKSNKTMNELYHGGKNFGDFSLCIQKTRKKYSKMKTLFYTEREHDFYDIFVCNDIGYDIFQLERKKESIVKEIAKQELIKRANLEEPDNNTVQIIKGSKELWENRERKNVIPANMDSLNEVSKYTILVGIGGMGKSMMMRHLFLSSNEKYKKSGFLPILVALREFNSQKTNLIEMLTDSVSRFDPSFTVFCLKNLLSNGKCLLLLDGLDEIKSIDLNVFLKQLDALVDLYPSNQIVISSRKYSSFVELSRFTILDIMPFTLKQSIELIEKLDYCPEEPRLKEQFIVRLKKEYINTHAQFVNNPLLLTLMLMSYQIFADIPEKRHLFYKQAYETLLLRHDSSKLYNRTFHSSNDPSEFSEVFREFCAKSFRKHDYEFDSTRMSFYFSKLKKIEWIKHDKMTLDNFKYDACHSVCILHKEGEMYYFLHRSFQEYLFADYYASKDGVTLHKLRKSLFEAGYNPADDESAFMMMYDLNPENVEKFVLYPFLEEIFGSKEKSENEQFWCYLSTCYTEWKFVSINDLDLMMKCDIDSSSKANDALIKWRNKGFVEKNVIIIQLKRIIKDKSLLLPLESSNVELDRNLYFVNQLYAARWTGVSYSLCEFKSDDVELIDDTGGLCIKRKGTSSETFAYIGFSGSASVKDIVGNPTKYSKVISILEDDDSPAKKEFFEMKNLYYRLKSNYEHANDLDDDDF